MSEPITPRGFEPRSLKNTLGRRPAPVEPSGPQLPADPGTAQQNKTQTPGGAAASPASPDRPDSAVSASTPARQQAPVARPRVARARTAGAPSASKEAAAGRTRPRAPRGQTVFYLPFDLSEQLRDAAREQAKTHAEVIFDAIEAQLDQLGALLHEAEPVTSGGGVFTRAEPRQAGPKVQVSGQIRSDNLSVIDRLVEQHGAGSRSQLIEVALRAHLDGPGTSNR
jgi:hypothetical protein